MKLHATDWALVMLYVSALVLFTGCSALTPKGQIVDKPGLSGAMSTAWTFYGRKDPPPRVRIVEGAELTCTVAENGRPGFSCAGQCKNGCTMNPLDVSIAYEGTAWYLTTLCHETEHVVLTREAIAGVISERDIGAAFPALQDWNHTRVEWKKLSDCPISPGRCGLVAQCNDVLKGVQ